MPIKCSAEMLDAMSEAPMAHQVREPSAKKKSLDEPGDELLFFL
jgi:hypothetical protein